MFNQKTKFIDASVQLTPLPHLLFPSTGPSTTSHFAPIDSRLLREPVPETTGWPSLWCGRTMGARMSGPRVTFSRGSRGDGASPTRSGVAHAMPWSNGRSVTFVWEDSKYISGFRAPLQGWATCKGVIAGTKTDYKTEPTLE